MSFLLNTDPLVENAYLFIRCNKTKFFLQKANITDINGGHKQNTHTSNT